MNNNIFFKNFLNLSLNQGINILAAIIVTPILFNKLGSEGYGLVSLSFSIIMILSILVSYGYHLNGPKRISLISLKEKKKLINEILFIRVFFAIIISITIFFLTFFFNFFNGYEKIILFSLILLFSEALHPLFYLQGENNLSVQAIINAISKIFFVSLIIFSIKSSEDSFLVNFYVGGVLFISYFIFCFSLFISLNVIF